MNDKKTRTLDQFFEDEKNRVNHVGIVEEIELPNMDELHGLIAKWCEPPDTGEALFPTLFGKYGGSDCFGYYRWIESELKKSDATDLWKMLAIASTYWCLNYKNWYKKEQYKNMAHKREKKTSK